MKKLLFIIGLILSCSLANGQGNWGATYTPYNPNQSSGNNQSSTSNQSNQQSQSIRTTAYYVDSRGDVYKVPIKVEERQGWGTAYYVVERYVANSLGGKWEKLFQPAKIEQCSSYGNSLESRYMYKANILNTGWHYFDL